MYLLVVHVVCGRGTALVLLLSLNWALGGRLRICHEGFTAEMRQRALRGFPQADLDVLVSWGQEVT